MEKARKEWLSTIALPCILSCLMTAVTMSIVGWMSIGRHMVMRDELPKDILTKRDIAHFPYPYNNDKPRLDQVIQAMQEDIAEIKITQRDMRDQEMEMQKKIAELTVKVESLN